MGAGFATGVGQATFLQLMAISYLESKCVSPLRNAHGQDLNINHFMIVAWPLPQSLLGIAFAEKYLQKYVPAYILPYEVQRAAILSVLVLT